MPYTTKKEKQQIALHIHKFIQAGHKISIKRYVRMMSWLNDMPFAEIAREEGVTPQAVANSVRRDSKIIIKFAEENN